MTSHIESFGLQLGDTPEGRSWCLKALNPASPVVECRGIPDESAIPTAFLNYQSTFTIAPAAAATGTWQFDAALLPHPVNMMFLSKTDTTGTAVSANLNTQLAGATHALKMASWLGFAQRWRLAYAAVTVYQDGPALADQGTMASCQSPCKPLLGCVAYPNAAGTASISSARVAFWDATDPPSFDYMQNLPNSYLNRSKEGLYLPLKLTRTCQNWVGQADLIHGSQANLSAVTAGGAQIATAGTACGNFPHPDLPQVFWNPGVSSGGTVTSPLCNDVLGFFAVRNVAVTTQFTCFVRMGWEIQCQPGTPYTPQLALSPPHDDRALMTYFAVARQLKDAYPADYNDLGKIWEVIKGALSIIGPGLRMIPVVGPALSAAAPLAVKAGDAIGNLITKAQQKKQLTVQSEATRAAAAKKVVKALSAKPGSQVKVEGPVKGSKPSAELKRALQIVRGSERKVR